MALSISPPLASLFLAIPLPLDLLAPCFAPFCLEILIACAGECPSFLPRLIWPPIGLFFFSIALLHCLCLPRASQVFSSHAPFALLSARHSPLSSPLECTKCWGGGGVCQTPWLSPSVSCISRGGKRSYREGRSGLGMFVLVTLHR